MEIEHRHHRHIADNVPHQSEDHTLHVVLAVGDHRAVEVEEHAVQRSGVRQRSPEPGAQHFQCLGSHPTGRPGAGSEERHRLESRCVEDASEHRPGAGMTIDDGVTFEQFEGFEVPQRRRSDRVGVGLVPQAAEADPLHSRLRAAATRSSVVSSSRSPWAAERYQMPRAATHTPSSHSNSASLR